jgi:hypothetical protein
MADLAALTPPLVVCAAFVIGLVILLRHQLAPKRRDLALKGGEDAQSRTDTGTGTSQDPGPTS